MNKESLDKRETRTIKSWMLGVFLFSYYYHVDLFRIIFGIYVAEWWNSNYDGLNFKFLLFWFAIDHCEWLKQCSWKEKQILILCRKNLLLRILLSFTLQLKLEELRDQLTKKKAEMEHMLERTLEVRRMKDQLQQTLQQVFFKNENLYV